MNVESILTSTRTFCHLEASSKKRAIEKAATLIAASESYLDAGEIYTNLIAREKLGPTALGNGIALPHCRLRGTTEIIGALFTLSTPVDFGAMDDIPVSIMFALLVPEKEINNHLQVMAMLAQKFDTEAFRHRLLTSSNAAELYSRAIVEVDSSSPS